MQSLRAVRDRASKTLVSEILQIWSYRLAHPEYQRENLELDCGMMFREAVPAAWIESVIPIDDAEFRSS